LKKRVARPRPSADLRERECTFLISRSERYDGQTVLRFKSNFENFLLDAFINWQPIKLLKEGSDPTFKYEACYLILSKLLRPQRAFRKASKKSITIV